jgi:dihydrolipoamide dehydrogenase
MATIKKKALVIGAGTGGYPAAIRLGQLDVDAMLVEKHRPGGVCLNVGCIPSKALISASKLLHRAQHAQEMGIDFPAPSVDMGQMQQWKRGIIDKLCGGVEGLVRASGCEYRSATARFLGPKQIELSNADGSRDVVETEHVVIATGSRPIQIPGFDFDHEHILDSTSCLALDHVPGQMIVIGGGYIGLELGQVFQRLGAELTVVEGLERILPSMDKELGQLVAKQIRADGGTILTRAEASRWELRDGKAVVSVKAKGEIKEISADVVVVAVGRKPVTDGFAIEASGVAIDEGGFITVDDRMQTNVPGVYAVGDVAGPPMLAHKASHEGEVVAEVIAGRPVKNEACVIPNVVFTDPEIATAGLGKKEAEAEGRDVKVGKFPFAASGRALALGDSKGFVKVVVDAADDRILGIQIVGPEASDLISEAALAIELGASAADIGRTIHPHPTLGEAVMEAAKHSIGEAIHLQNRKR